MEISEIKTWIKNNLFDCNQKISASKISLKKYDGKFFNQTIYYDNIVKKTAFLQNSSVSITNRLFCILNDIIEIPKCKLCGKDLVFDKVFTKYTIYCSTKCVSRDTRIRAMKTFTLDKRRIAVKKRKITFIEKFGKHPMQCEYFKKKARETCLDKFGVNHYLSSEKASEERKNFWKNITDEGRKNWNKKHIETSLKKYNVNHPNQRHISKESLELLNDREWLETQCQSRSYCDIGKELGVSDACIKLYIEKFGIINDKKYHGVGFIRNSLFETNDKTKDIPAIFYVVLFSNKFKDETFVKIGITTRTIHLRFNKSIYNDYKMNVKFKKVMCLYDCFQLEQLMIKKLHKYLQMPVDDNFTGKTECFSKGSLTHILKLSKCT